MEGPSLIILKEELRPYLKAKVLSVTGNSKQPIHTLAGQTLRRVETWGKNLFLFFSKGEVVKIHFLMFGSYRINDPKPERVPRLQLDFKKGTLYFYACSVRFDGEEYWDAVDREVDVMSETWNEKHVLEVMRKKKSQLLCDLFLDQTVFAGSGNIVKNEVLFNIRKHPLTKLKDVAPGDWPKLARAIHDYCFSFYEWKKKFELRKHWQIYRQSKCPLCDRKVKRENLGKFKRRTFYCIVHQPLRARTKAVRIHPVLPMRGNPAEGRALDH
jgi:endonuclease VIII